jgi:hypothetical protein
MQAFLVNLMAATLIIQSVFGCCRGGLPCLGKEEIRAVATSHCCHSCNHSSQENQLPSSPCKAQCSGVCTYVPTSKTVVENPDLIWQAHLAAVIFAAADGPNQGFATLTDPGQSNDLVPPTRLHLLNQIWLI